VAWRIEWTPAAAVEAEAEAAKYALKREGLGDRFLDEIDATIERITEGPEHFQRWPDDPSYRRAVVHVFPFVVFYRMTNHATRCSSCPWPRRSVNLATGNRKSQVTCFLSWGIRVPGGSLTRPGQGRCDRPIRM
jgi:hypothetical protein